MSDRPASAPAESFLSARETLADLPHETDVLIVGGGIVGNALAYYLSAAGVETLLIDRSELNREASGTNAGSFHFQIALHQLTADETEGDRARLLEEVREQIAAADIWSQLEKDLDADLGVHETGGLMVAETAEELQLLFDKQAIERDAGLETHVLVGRELREFAPYLAPDLTGASYCPREGHANPFTAVPYLALRAHARGAAIRTQAGVTRITVDEAGGAHRFVVETTRGTVRASRLVNAAGAWANDLSIPLGVRLPLRAEGLHVNVTEPREHVLMPMVQHIGRRLTLKQTANNTFIIGGGWPARPERAPTRYSNYWASAAGNAAVAVRVMPMLADVRLVRTWTGVMAFMDDLSPIVGESARVPGYFVCVANTGFTMGPMMAGMLAEALVSGSSSSLNPDYSPDRVVLLRT